MRHQRLTRSLTTTAILVLSCGLLADSLAAQGSGGPLNPFSGNGRIDPEPAGKDTDGPVPRLPDGTPNLGRTEIGKGVWLPFANPEVNYSEILVDPPKLQGIPYQPWARALQQYRDKVTLQREEPGGFCIPPAGPMVNIRVQTRSQPDSRSRT